MTPATARFMGRARRMSAHYDSPAATELRRNQGLNMSDWQEPEVIATFDRTWKNKSERLQLERGEYNDRPTFTLRTCWLANDGTWRWSAARPNTNGKIWHAMPLRARELRALGEALIKAADDSEGTPRREPPQPRRGLQRTPEYDDAMGKRYEGPGHDADLPF